MINYAKHKNKVNIVITCFVFLLAGIQLFIPLFNHYNFRTFTFDYGVYNFAFFDYAHAHLSDCPMSLVFDSHTNFLQDHFSLTVILLSPLYWLLYFIIGTYTLLFVQWVFITVGAFATYKLVMLKSRNQTLSLLSLVYFFVLYGRYSSYQNDCNLAIIGAAMIPVFVYFFESENKLATIISFVFLIINREDFSLCLVFITLFLAYNHRRNIPLRRFALLLALLAVISFVVIYKVLIPWVDGEGHQYKLFEYSVLGTDPVAALKFILMHPLQTIKLLFINHTNEAYNDYMKTGFYLVYGISGGFLLLWRPIYLVFLIPFIAKKMFNDYNNRWGYEMYYSIEVATFLPILVFDLICYKFNAKWRIFVAIIVITVTTSVSIYCLSIANYPNPYQKFNILKSDYFKIDIGTNAAHQIISQIPNNASVSASDRVLPHLAYRSKIYHFPDIRDAEYVCLLTSGDTYPINQQKFDSTWKSLIYSGQWQVKLSTESLILLQKKAIK